MALSLTEQERIYMFSSGRYSGKFRGIDALLYGAPVLLNPRPIKQEIPEHMKKETENTYTVTRDQLKQIHDIACDAWKETILDMAKTIDPFNDRMELHEGHVKGMFNASSEEQLRVLEDIFPDYDDGNAFKKNMGTTQIGVVRTSLANLSLTAFGEKNAVYLRFAGTIHKPKRALYVHRDFKVVVSEESDGATEILILNK